jgi:hypothetical protein
MHCGKGMTEDTLAAAGFQVFSICRKLIGWEGETILAAGGRWENPSNGGTISAALESMMLAGVGMGHEALDPYPDPGTSDDSVFAVKPPATVWNDANGYRLLTSAEVEIPKSGDRLVNVRHAIGVDKQAVGFGVWCPNNWSNPGPIFTNINGGGEYGHAVECRGYALASAVGLDTGGVSANEYLYEFPQWWGYIYSLLDPAVVSKWTGLKPWTGNDPNGNPASNAFYITGKALLQIIDQGNAEVVVCSGATGLPSVVPTPTPTPTPPQPPPDPTPGPDPDPFNDYV